MVTASCSLRVLTFALTCCVIAFTAIPASSGTVDQVAALHESTLFAFPDAAHGEDPQSPFARDAQGNIYGATHKGGPAGAGVVFELTPNARGFSETILYSFSGSGEVGIEPGPLSIDAAGNLWGMTRKGIFELTHETGGAWHAKLIVACSTFGMPLTLAGGAVYGACAYSGELVKLTRAGSAFHETTLHRFGANSNLYPNGGLIVDNNGDVFGTSWGSGAGCCANAGPMYELTRSGSRYHFANLFYSGTFYGPLIDGNGAIYTMEFYPGAAGVGDILKALPGPTGYDLTYPDNSVGKGTGTPIMTSSGALYFGNGSLVEKLTPGHTGYMLSVAYRFPTPVRLNQLTIDAAGNIFGGTANDGVAKCGRSGRSGCGTIFELTP